MNREAQPPKAARWLLGHFGCSPNNEAVVGDLDERYRTGRYSAAWYWKQILIAGVVEIQTQIRSGRSIYVKQAAKWAFIIVGLLSVGFWAGRRPVFAPVQSPPLIDAAHNAETRADMLFGTIQFLQMELDKAVAVNAREQSAVSQQRVEDFERKLEQAHEAMKLEATQQFSKLPTLNR